VMLSCNALVTSLGIFAGDTVASRCILPGSFIGDGDFDDGICIPGSSRVRGPACSLDDESEAGLGSVRYSNDKGVLIVVGAELSPASAAEVGPWTRYRDAGPTTPVLTISTSHCIFTTGTFHSIAFWNFAPVPDGQSKCVACREKFGS
jgi:hypothetical protein